MDQYNPPAEAGEEASAEPSPYNIVCTQPRRISAIGERTPPSLVSATAAFAPTSPTRALAIEQILCQVGKHVNIIMMYGVIPCLMS